MLANLARRAWHSIQLRKAGVVVAMIGMSLVVGRYPTVFWLILAAAIVGFVLLLQWPALALLAIPMLAIYSRFSIGTGTAVELNAPVMVVPVGGALWGLESLRSREAHVAPSPANRPMVLFLLSAMLSLLVGNALWDPAVPRPGNIVMVQLAQWAIFAFAALAFWLGGGLLRTERWLKALVWSVVIFGGLAIAIRLVPGGERVAHRWMSLTLFRSPFWALMLAVAGGQLAFNRKLGSGTQIALALICLGTVVYAFVLGRETSSNWVGVGTAIGVLAWLRFPKMRVAAIILFIALVVGGGLTQRVYDFAGGADEWEESGGSRLALIGRVLKVAMHNPITGLGPASYRAYANVEPLKYGRAYWVNPQINSHNNYVDIFAHTGIVGLSLLGWFYWEIWWHGWRVSQKHRSGFLGGLVATGLAIIASMVALMLFADWILPFVYNIGFPGFQASILMWLFLGAMVAADALPAETDAR